MNYIKIDKVLTFRGEDTVSFLDSLISNEFVEGKIVPSFLLFPDGKINYWFLAEKQIEAVNIYQNYEELLKLPGIGRYTAAAISSICYNERKFVVDANVFRVLSRYYGINKNISNSNAYSFFEKISQNIGENTKSVGIYNEAIMDFGGSICTPKKPHCHKCVINYSCVANRNGKQNFFPVKNKKRIKKNRYFNYFILENDEMFLMQKYREMVGGEAC